MATGLPTILGVNLVTPRGVVAHTDADSVQAPGELGEFELLPGHVPMLTALKPGVLTIGTKTRQRYAVSSGYLRVDPSGAVEILVEQAMPTVEIDAEAAKKDLGRRRGRAREVGRSAARRRLHEHPAARRLGARAARRRCALSGHASSGNFPRRNARTSAHMARATVVDNDEDEPQSCCPCVGPLRGVRISGTPSLQSWRSRLPLAVDSVPARRSPAEPTAGSMRRAIPAAAVVVTTAGSTRRRAPGPATGRKAGRCVWTRRPSKAVQLMGMLDTDKSDGANPCLKNQPTSWTATQPDACIIVGDTVTVALAERQGKPTARPRRADAGSRSSVLLDVASHRSTGGRGCRIRVGRGVQAVRRQPGQWSARRWRCGGKLQVPGRQRRRRERGRPGQRAGRTGGRRRDRRTGAAARRLCGTARGWRQREGRWRRRRCRVPGLGWNDLHSGEDRCIGCGRCGPGQPARWWRWWLGRHDRPVRPVHPHDVDDHPDRRRRRWWWRKRAIRADDARG